MWPLDLDEAMEEDIDESEERIFLEKRIFFDSTQVKLSIPLAFPFAAQKKHKTSEAQFTRRKAKQAML